MRSSTNYALNGQLYSFGRCVCKSHLKLRKHPVLVQEKEEVECGPKTNVLVQPIAECLVEVPGERPVRTDLMRVANILSVSRQRMVAIQADTLLTEAAKLLCGAHRALLVVCNSKGMMTGVVTKTDIVRRVAHNAILSDVRIVDVMTIAVTYCRPEDSLHDVLALMHLRDFVHIPIIEEGFRPCGVVNARDALQALLGEVEDEEQLLRAYIGGIGYR
jgi:CBS domain-containing protein